MINSKIEDNIPKFISYQIFNGFIFFAPVLVLYLQSKGLTMTQILTLQSIFAFGMVIMEVPTGAFADRYGKRISLVLGSFFFTLGLTIYGISSNFLQFIIGELWASIGMAFISGADSAFLHETLKSLKRDDEYTKITGRTAGLTQVAGAIGSVIGGFIGNISLGLTFILSSLSPFIASLIGLSFAKPMITLEREEKTNYIDIITSSISVIHKTIPLPIKRH
jgi:MFS family permease